MRELAFVGLSDDGTSLVLSSSDGTRYVVPCDERLESAVRRDRSRLGQLEIALDGTTPKDIQQRVRFGQTPDDIAASSGLPIERVLRFAGPVIAERQFIAAQALEVELRTHDRTLEALVLDALALGGVDTDVVEWDAWRREDGRWSLLASWEPADNATPPVGAAAALWVYDPAGRTIVSDDSASSWLLGERPESVEHEPLEPGRPHLVGLPAHDEDVDTWDDDSHDPDAAFTAIVERHSGAEVVDLADRPPVEPDDSAPLDDLYDTLPGLARPEASKPSRRERRKAARPTPAPAGDAAKGNKARASVPSWDEILFGTKNPER